jgi:hypothetical protein
VEIVAAQVHKRFPAAAEYLSGIYILARDYGRVTNSRLASVVRIIRITEEGEQIPLMLDFCMMRGIKPGATFTVVGKAGEIIRLGRPRPDGHGVNQPEIEIPLEKSQHVRYEPLPELMHINS